MKLKIFNFIVFFGLLGLFSIGRTIEVGALNKTNFIDTYESLKTHKVFQIVQGRWRGAEVSVYKETGEKKEIVRDFRIGPSVDGARLVFESLIPNDPYIGYFSSYDEDCLQYDEYGFVQHLCLGPSGYVVWSGPCSAGSYRTRMTRAKQEGEDVMIKSGNHWDHQGRLHRQNSGVFSKIQETWE